MLLRRGETMILKTGIAMDLLAQYLMVNHQTLDRLMEMDSESLIKNMVKLNNLGTDGTLQINKMWDGLHFLLTGISARDVAAHSTLLSKAVIGAHLFNDDDENRYFVSYTTAKELPQLLNAMQQVDLTALSKQFKTAQFRTQQIYPNIWRDKYSVALFCELSETFQKLLAFTKKAYVRNQNIVFSIY